MNATVTEIGCQTTRLPEARPRGQTRRMPLYNVILLDDNDHTYEYVMEMLRKLWGYPPERSYELAAEVDSSGRVVIDTTSLERAELKRDQIHAFGRDWRIPRCQGSMSAVIEPAATGE